MDCREQRSLDYVTSGASGTGNGTIFYSVGVNSTGSPRIGTITIAGLTFTVNQSNVNCTYSISPMNASYPAGGGSWQRRRDRARRVSYGKLISQDDWITVTAGGNGSGNGTFNYSVDPNGGAARTGTIDIEGQMFTVNQSGRAGAAFRSLRGAPCSVKRAAKGV